MVMVMAYSGPVDGAPWGAGLYLAMKPNWEETIRWDFLSWPSYCCPFGIEWSLGPVVNGWLYVYWRSIAVCGDVRFSYAIPIPGCTQGTRDSSYYPWPLRYTDPPRYWPGPERGCLYATCNSWHVCGDNTGFLIPENVNYVDPDCF
jgi:hypothetical protein